MSNYASLEYCLRNLGNQFRRSVEELDLIAPDNIKLRQIHQYDEAMDSIERFARAALRKLTRRRTSDAR